MLKVTKVAEPDFLLKFKQKHKPQDWNDYDYQIKEQLKKHMLETEQEQYCPYCERNICDVATSHIEHIYPRSKFPKKSQDYENLLTSCNTKNTCGEFKDNKFTDHFINPVLENPMEFLVHNIATGKIEPLNKNQHDLAHQRASYTIETLNLNEKNLVESRKNLSNLLLGMKKKYQEAEYCEYLKWYLEDKHNFKSLLEWHFNNCHT